MFMKSSSFSEQAFFAVFTNIGMPIASRRGLCVHACGIALRTDVQFYGKCIVGFWIQQNTARAAARDDERSNSEGEEVVFIVKARMVP
jgi:hypothetical protein